MERVEGEVMERFKVVEELRGGNDEVKFRMSKLFLVCTVRWRRWWRGGWRKWTNLVGADLWVEGCEGQLQAVGEGSGGDVRGGQGRVEQLKGDISM